MTNTLARNLTAFSTLLLLGGAVPSAQALDLLVGNLVEDSVTRFDGITGAFVSTLVPTGGGGLDGPAGLTLGSDGTLYVANQVAGNVHRYNAATGADLGVFTSGFTMNGPEGIVFGPDGSLYVSDLFNNSVQRYDGTTGAYINTFVSSGSGGLLTPRELLFTSDGSLLVASFNSGEVLRYNSTGAFQGTFVAAGAGGLINPFGITFGADGNLYVSDYGSNTVKRYDGVTGTYIDDFVSVFQINSPIDLEFGPDGNLYVAGLNSGGILRFDGSTGAFIDLFAATTTPYYFLFSSGTTSVPEPNSIALFIGLSITGTGVCLRRRRK